jgi:phosphotransferase system HPr-like phosphotransfer protein
MSERTETMSASGVNAWVKKSAGKVASLAFAGGTGVTIEIEGDEDELLAFARNLEEAIRAGRRNA